MRTRQERASALAGHVVRLMCVLGLVCAGQEAPAEGGVDTLLQQEQQFPVWDLDAAWSTALARGPLAPEAIPSPRFSASTALVGAQVALDRAQVFVIDVPVGMRRVHGNITVGPGQLLMLQGQGGLTDTQQVPLSTWVFANNTRADINVLPGGVVYLRNLTLINPTFGLFGTATTFVPSPLVAPSDPWAAAIAMESVAFIVNDCSLFEATQNYVCGMLLHDLNVPWPAVEIEPTWLFIYRLQAPAGNVSIDYALWTCSWPPASLQPARLDSSVSPSSAADAPPVRSDLYAASILQLSPSGFPSGPLPPLPSSATLPGVSPAGVQRLDCVARRVNSSSQMERALIELQAMSTNFVVVQVVLNMTLQQISPASLWPAENMALRIYRNVTILGRHILTARVTEIDFNNLRNVFWVAPTGQLRFQQLTLANSPCGPKAFFPANMLAVMMWSVAWNRTVTDRNFLEIKNSTVVQPEDNFDYTSYWVGIQASPIPRVREMGAWQANLVFNGSLEVSSDNHTLFIQNRWGRGIQWMNTSLTDLPVVAPLKYPPLGCGISRLIPGDPYFPYSRITPVYNPHDLGVYLQQPPTQVLILLNNITLSRSTAWTTLQPGSADDSGTTALPLDQAAAAAHSKLSTHAALLNKSEVTLTTELTILGWHEDSTVLNMDNAAGLIELQMPMGRQLFLKRLTLAGLGPADPDQQPSELANLTSSLWAFDYDRRREQIALQNVTMLLSETEIARLQTIRASSLFPADDSTRLPLTSMVPLSLLQLQSSWSTGKVRNSSPGELVVASVTYNGIQAADLILTSTLSPDLVSRANITLPMAHLQVLQALDALTGTAEAPDESGGLRGWKVVVLAVSVALGALAGAGLFAWRIVQIYKRVGTQNKADKVDADGNSSSSQRGTVMHGDVTNQLRVVVGSSGSSSPLRPSARTSSSRRQSLAVPSSQAYLSTRIPLAQASGARSEAAMTQGSISATPRSSIVSGGAPDDEIRQLVNTQRERTLARSGGDAAGNTLELEGVTLDAVLGQGSFGVVYLGHWRGMQVAVKTIMFNDAGPATRRARQRAVTEAAINTLLSHECICNMYAYDLRPMAPAGLPDDRFSAHYRLYIIQEYCDAGSLADAIDQGTFLGPEGRNMGAILQVALQIARGLAYIHDNNVIHGDLSAGNIMLRSSPGSLLGFQAKVCDFGLSRFLEGPEQSHISNARQGTPFYMAPEVITHGIISREADSFSLGVILWELFHAQRPPWRDPCVLAAAREQQVQQQRPRPDASSVGTPPDTGGWCGQQRESNVGEASTCGVLAKNATLPSKEIEPMPPRPMLLLDPRTPSGFSFPLPHDAPQAYADVVASCLHPIPKVRPRVMDVVVILRRLAEQAGVRTEDIPSAAEVKVRLAKVSAPSAPGLLAHGLPEAATADAAGVQVQEHQEGRKTEGQNEQATQEQELEQQQQNSPPRVSHGARNASWPAAVTPVHHTITLGSSSLGLAVGSNTVTITQGISDNTPAGDSLFSDVGSFQQRQQAGANQVFSGMATAELFDSLELSRLNIAL